MKRAHVVCPVSAIENQYSMVWREPEKEVFNICEELGISFVAYSPLGNGSLSGKYTKDTKYEEGDFRSFMKRFKLEVMGHNQALLDLIAKVAESKNATSAQIVLAWELAQKSYIIPIPDTRKLHRLEENLGAANIELTEEKMVIINDSLSKIYIDEANF